METRELYKQKYEAQLHEWSAKLEALIAHTDVLTAQAKLDAKPHLDELHGKLDLAKSKLHEIAQTKSAEHAWAEVKGAIEGAYDAIKPDKKN